MPDLKPTDVATKFVRAKLGRLMAQVLFDRDTCVINYKDNDTIRLLNRAIDRAGLIRGNAWVRVAEVDQAMKDLKVAYQDALKAPNKKDAPASPSFCMPAANAPITLAWYQLILGATVVVPRIASGVAGYVSRDQCPFHIRGNGVSRSRHRWMMRKPRCW